MDNQKNNSVSSRAIRKIKHKVWWLQHRRRIILTLVTLVGAAIFAHHFAKLLSL